MTVTSLVERNTVISRSAERPIYRDPERPLEERLDSLLTSMTLAEKIAQLSAVRVSELITDEKLDSEKLSARLADGTAAITGIAAIAGLDPVGYSQFSRRLQEHLRAHTRLGIPALICEDGSAAQGVVTQDQIPPPIACAASFDPVTLRALADCLRETLRALGVTQIFAPSLGIVDQPQRPELMGSYGDQPYLVGQLGVAFLRGLAGERKREAVLAAAGSFLGTPGAADTTRSRGVHLGRRELREILAEPFAAAVREAGLSAVVAADGTIDGIACNGAPEVLTDLLRGELGFRGLVFSARQGIRNLIEHHRVAADELSAAVLALSAGVDVELSGGCYSAALSEAIEARQISTDQLDVAVRRVLQQKLQLGLMDDLLDSADDDGNENSSARANSVADDAAEWLEGLAARLAEESIVLVKNLGNLLPLRQDEKIGLAGDDAAGLAAALSDLDWNQTVVIEFDATSVESAASKLSGFTRVVVTINGAPEEAGGPSEPSSSQLALLRHLLQRRTPVTVVMTGSCAATIGLLPPDIPAIVANWCPGLLGQRALARTLTGAVNPSGRMPVALPQLPQDFRSRPPLYGFGHGLSYSHFEYRDLLSVDTVDTHGAVEVSVEVINESALTGCEVVQLYLHDPVAEVSRQPRQLAGFHRLNLAPGQAKRVIFQLDVSQFGYYNRKLEYVVDPGRIDLMVGPSSTDIRSRRRLTVQGDRRLFKQQQRLSTQSHDQDISP